MSSLEFYGYNSNTTLEGLSKYRNCSSQGFAQAIEKTAVPFKQQEVPPLAYVSLVFGWVHLVTICVNYYIAYRLWQALGVGGRHGGG